MDPRISANDRVLLSIRFNETEAATKNKCKNLLL